MPLYYGPFKGRTATYIIAASDAPAHVKAQADYVCDGTADNVEIQAAIAALPASGGRVVLSVGTFNCGVVYPRSGLTLEGVGKATVWNVTPGLVFDVNTSVSGVTVRGIYFSYTGANLADFFISRTAFPCTGLLVEGCEFRGIVFKWESATSLRIEGNYFHDAIATVPANGAALNGLASNNILIKGNFIKDYNGMGIGVSTSSILKIIGNTIECAGSPVGHGIDTNGSTTVSIIGNSINALYGINSENSAGIIEISDNLVTGNGAALGSGINVWRVAVGDNKAVSVVISNNIISNCNQLIGVRYIGSVLISGNKGYGSNGGSFIYNCDGDITILGNQMDGTGVTGSGFAIKRETVALPQALSIIITSNKLSHWQYGLYIYDELEAIIGHNEISYTSQSGVIVGATAPWGTPFRRVMIESNSIYKADVGGAWQPCISISNTDNVDIVGNELDGGTSANTRGILYSSIASAPNSKIIDNRILNCSVSKLEAVPSDVRVSRNIGYVTENSGVAQGTGAQQLVAHGLAIIPTRQQIALFAGSTTANPFHSADPDATNIKVTAVAGQAWYWATVGG